MVKLSKSYITANKSKYATGCLDIGKYSQHCYVESPSGKYLKAFEFKNNKAGFTECYEKIDNFCKEEKLEGIVLGVESTGTYGEAVTNWLLGKGINVVGVNPKHVHRMKELVGNSPGKTDKKDPKVGTLIVNAGRYHELLQPKGIAAELRSLTKYRQQLKINEGRLLNQLESQIVRIFPEFLIVMKGLSTKTSIGILGRYTLPGDILDLGKEKLTKLLKELSRSRLGEQRAEELYQAAEQSIGIQEGLIGISLAIKSLVKQLQSVRAQIVEMELTIESLLIEHEEAEILLSVPGIGFITASEIIGETGGLNNYSNPNKLIKLAGINLFEISSGTHKGIKRITKRGRSSFRRILYLAALRTIKKNGIFRKHYDEYSKRMKNPQAIIAIAKKLVRTLFSLVKRQEKFDLKKVQ